MDTGDTIAALVVAALGDRARLPGPAHTPRGPP